MKKLKQNISKIFDDEDYHELDGRKYIKDFINQNRNKFKNIDSLKLMIRFCIKEYEEERTRQNDKTGSSESYDSSDR